MPNCRVLRRGFIRGRRLFAFIPRLTGRNTDLLARWAADLLARMLLAYSERSPAGWAAEFNDRHRATLFGCL
jgi:hypothetical protein